MGQFEPRNTQSVLKPNQLRPSGISASPAPPPPPPAKLANTTSLKQIAPESIQRRENQRPIHRAKSPLRKWIFIVVAVALTLSLTGATFKMSQDIAKETLPPSNNFPHARNIVAPGLVESESGQRHLSYEIPGILKSVTVHEGQRVQAGDLIAELENSDASARVLSAQADFAMAEAQLKIDMGNRTAEIEKATYQIDRLKAELALLDAGARKEEIARMHAERRVAEVEAQRALQDAARFADPAGLKSGAWSEAEISRLQWNSEAAKGRLEMAKASQSMLENGYRKEEKDRARASLASAEAELSQLISTQPFKTAAAQAQVVQAKAKLSIAEASLAKTRLFSPINGVVVWKYLHAGEAVDPTHPTPVVAVADTSQLRVRADVDEADYPLIRKGQLVHVAADAFRQKTFTGKVQRVSESAGQKRFSTGEAKERMDVKVVETIIVLDESCPFKLGLRVTVNFESDESKPLSRK